MQAADREISGSRTMPPDPGAFRHLRPRDLAGLGFFGLACFVTAAAAWLAVSGGAWRWAAGQLLFALAFVQWFVLLHEAGHRTLFRTRALNPLAGWVAGFFALIPYPSWQRIHARHHRWTGWQDLDATTASLVPRPLAQWERRAVNFAWKTGMPLFSVMYRLSNYWNLRRLAAFLPSEQIARLKLGVVLYLAGYAILALAVGPLVLLKCCAVGRLLALAVEDPLLLSQHTHVPQRVSAGERVRPFTPFEQQAFTRSLRLPGWLSWLILHFDAHELHHMYVRVPGYDLRRIPYRPSNEVGWWVWLRGAKRLPGTVFLFQNRMQTGFTL
jgi:omega-6 fatty acid desaturase (delta-12 desaturase)